MINVVADGAFGVGHAVLVAERFSHKGSVKARGESSTLKAGTVKIPGAAVKTRPPDVLR